MSDNKELIKGIAIGVGASAALCFVARALCGSCCSAPKKDDKKADSASSVSEDQALRTLFAADLTKGDERQKNVRKVLAQRILWGHKNLAMKHFPYETYAALDDKGKDELLWIVHSGTECGDSEVGCYACRPTDYSTYAKFFNPVLRGYHKVGAGAKHVSSWDLPKGDADLPENGKLDLHRFHLKDVSMRVRVGRNLKNFPLPAAMTKEDRVNMENKLYEAFKVLIAKEEFGGHYYSLTPGHERHIPDEKYKELVHEHLMFKDMSKDSFLLEAGIASDWPFGRGCYVSADKNVIVWVGEEDHTRQMCMQKGTVLNDVFDRLKVVIDTIQSLPGLEFAFDENLGAITSCPSNLGTAMRASVHLQCPNLTADGTETRVRDIAKPLHLSVRGKGGEHTPIGKDGTVDISPSSRFCITEGQIIANLYKGIKAIVEAEKEAEKEPGSPASAHGHHSSHGSHKHHGHHKHH